MNKEELVTTIVQALRVSEKATGLQAQRTYVFKVRSDATKGSIKLAVGELFDVKVDKVRVCNMKALGMIFGGKRGKISGWKKAYVTLKEGGVIDTGVV